MAGTMGRVDSPVCSRGTVREAFISELIERSGVGAVLYISQNFEYFTRVWKRDGRAHVYSLAFPARVPLTSIGRRLHWYLTAGAT